MNAYGDDMTNNKNNTNVVKYYVNAGSYPIPCTIYFGEGIEPIVTSINIPKNYEIEIRTIITEEEEII